jgi:hypothetical protein
MDVLGSQHKDTFIASLFVVAPSTEQEVGLYARRVPREFLQHSPS